ncbi:MAG: pyridoxamine 5'-phosphate oxidase [Bacteroidales bacterium]|nr:pyridoxamine 5'-phosphate oxidase [Bacteroidales bacterium]MBN2762924.1 pyridoxamine 5'-phosphate oxidase [Bacteroidales bacterium]
MSDIASIRKEYRLARLEYDSLDTSPLNQFRFWLNHAIRAQIAEPTAMTLATAGADGRPSARIVLLKDMNADGLTFFGNYESKKGLQLETNPYAALVFFWPELERQVRIEGKVARSSERISDEYFNARPEGSKIGSWASPQSQRIPSREYLENLQRDYMLLFYRRKPERPENWGGYRLVPHLYEFWQGRENRLHDRFEYTLNGNMWEIHRLAP